MHAFLAFTKVLLLPLASKRPVLSRLCRWCVHAPSRCIDAHRQSGLPCVIECIPYFHFCSMRRRSGLSQLVFLLVVTTMVALAPALRAEACPTGYTEWDNNNNQCGKQICIASSISYSGICFVHHHHVPVDLGALDWGLPQCHTVPIPSSHARTRTHTHAPPLTYVAQFVPSATEAT